LFSRLPSTPAKIDTFENTICNYFAWVWDFLSFQEDWVVLEKTAENICA
jgi:hypothetical protein